MSWCFATLWTIAHQAPLSMGFSRQEYWSGLHFLLQGTFLTWRSNPGLLHCRLILYSLSHQGSKLNLQLTQIIMQKKWIRNGSNSIFYLTLLWISWGQRIRMHQFEISRVWNRTINYIHALENLIHWNVATLIWMEPLWILRRRHGTWCWPVGVFVSFQRRGVIQLDIH